MIIFLANQFVGDNISSGGDVIFVQILKRIKTLSVVLAPAIIQKRLLEHFPNIKIIQSDNSNKFKSASSVIGAIQTVNRYILRAYNSFLWLKVNAKPDDTLYLTGDFICNSLPAWLIKLIHPKINVVANFYHRNPSPFVRKGNNPLVSFFSRVLQIFSLFFIKHSASKIFALSEEGKRELIDLNFDPRSVVISGAGIDDRLASKYKNSKKKNNQLIYIGRVNITKGAFDLLEILILLNSQLSSWHCHFVGQGSKEDLIHLKSKAVKFGIDNKITIHGFLSDDEKYELLSTSRILLLPSKEEGFGIVIMEALSLNTSVICYDLPALKNLYNKWSDVHMVPVNNQKEFAISIDKIIQNNHFPKTFSQKIPTWDDIFQLQSPHLINRNK